MNQKKESAVRAIFNNCSFIVAVEGSTILQGNSGSFTVHNGSATALTEEEREVLRIFRNLPIRQRVEFLSFCYDFCDRHTNTGGVNHAVDPKKDH